MLRRRIGRPGLVGTMARTAVVAGTATAVTGGMTRRANQKAIEAQQAQAQQAAPAPTVPQTPAQAQAPAQPAPGTPPPQGGQSYTG